MKAHVEAELTRPEGRAGVPFAWLAVGVAVAVVAGVAAFVAGRAGRPAVPAPVAAPPSSPAAPGAPAGVVGVPAGAEGRNPIATAVATRTRLAADLSIVGSVSLSQDHFAVVGPLVPGRVVKLRAGVGDRVRRGEVLAEIDSAELGQALATYIAAQARAKAAEANLRRERDLAAQKISSERERELAEAKAVEDSAEARAALERLRAFGLEPADVAALTREGGSTGGRIPLRAPLAGMVVARTVTLGQAVERATDAFKIVDLDHLWVLLDLYEKDLPRVHVGQAVELRTEARPGEVLKARVAFVNPLVDEKTRTANVRIAFDNKDGKLQPGMFVTARLVGDPSHTAVEALTIPRKAVVTVEGRPLAFVRLKSGGFEKRQLELGPSGGDLVEVRRGVEAGEEVATDGAFLLKSELLR